MKRSLTRKFAKLSSPAREFTPPGTMVELSNGLFGTVVASTEGNLLQPKVAVNNDDGTPQVLNLTEARLFIRRSLDAQAAENPLDA